MQRWFIALFKNESDHSAFLSWLRAWELENKADTGAKIGFIRVPGQFSRWTLHCTDAQFETLWHSVTAFNGIAHE